MSVVRDNENYPIFDNDHLINQYDNETKNFITEFMKQYKNLFLQIIDNNKSPSNESHLCENNEETYDDVPKV